MDLSHRRYAVNCFIQDFNREQLIFLVNELSNIILNNDKEIGYDQILLKILKSQVNKGED